MISLLGKHIKIKIKNKVIFPFIDLYRGGKMYENRKILIGQFEYLMCKNANEQYYLCRYDTENKIGLKITFDNNEENDIENEIIKILSKQYIDKIVKTKSDL